MLKASVSTEVHASLDRLWGLLKETIDDPGRVLPDVTAVEILERVPGFTLRRMQVGALEIVERITVFEKRHEIDFVLVDHPLYAGQAVTRIEELFETPRPGLPLSLTLTLDWRRKDGEPDALDMGPTLEAAAAKIKSLAER
ncbi:MAG: AtaL-like protein [Pseudomonadota bacterium]